RLQVGVADLTCARSAVRCHAAALPAMPAVLVVRCAPTRDDLTVRSASVISNLNGSRDQRTNLMDENLQGTRWAKICLGPRSVGGTSISFPSGKNWTAVGGGNDLSRKGSYHRRPRRGCAGSVADRWKAIACLLLSAVERLAEIKEEEPSTKEADDEGRRGERCRASEGEVMRRSSSSVRRTAGGGISSSSSMPSWQKEAEYTDAEGYLLLLRQTHRRLLCFVGKQRSRLRLRRKGLLRREKKKRRRGVEMLLRLVAAFGRTVGKQQQQGGDDCEWTASPPW
ncbi:hypothetical protein B296_00036871, partial [Ensete ventricosum]